jgi:hypothetical protein
VRSASAILQVLLLPVNGKGDMPLHYCYLPLQVGAERYNLFTGCPQARTATIVLRGGSEQVGLCSCCLVLAWLTPRKMLLHSFQTAALDKLRFCVAGKCLLDTGAFAVAIVAATNLTSSQFGLSTPLTFCYLPVFVCTVH